MRATLFTQVLIGIDRMKKIFLCSTVLATGCMSYELPETTIASSTPNQVIVYSERMEISKAQSLASTQCQTYGKAAKLIAKADYWERNYVFDCVK